MEKPTSITNLSSDFKTIAKLEQENERLRAEISRLKDLVSGVSSTVRGPVSVKQVSDEELVCLKQLEFLRQLSDQRELTLEETKKAEIYVKMLTVISERTSDSGSDESPASVEELLANLDE